jgi:hypothetical protein
VARKLLGGFVQSNASLTQQMLEVTQRECLHSLVPRKLAQAIAKGGIRPSNCNAVPSGLRSLQSGSRPTSCPSKHPYPSPPRASMPQPLQKHAQGLMEAGDLKLQLERRVKAFWPSSCQAADRSLVESTSPEPSKPSKSRPLRSLLLRRSERHAR